MDAADVREFVDEWTEYGAELLWGPTPQQVMRRSAMKIKQNERMLERERSKLEAKEKELIARLRKCAATNGSRQELQNVALTVARCRKGMLKIDRMVLQLQGITQDMLSSNVTQAFTEVIHDVNVSLAQLRGLTGGVNGVNNTLINFQKEKARMEIANETLEDMLGDQDEEEDADETLAALADELNLAISFELPTVSKSQRVHVPPSEGTVDEVALDADLAVLTKRLAALGTSRPNDKDDRDDKPSSNANAVRAD